MWTNYKRATRYGTRSTMVDEDRRTLAWQRLLKPFDVVVAWNWVAFSATNEVLSYCSLCQFRIQANFGCCCCGFSSFSLRPSIDVACDGHVGRWISSPLVHAVEAPGTFVWHFLGTSGIYVDTDQITSDPLWSEQERAPLRQPYMRGCSLGCGESHESVELEVIDVFVISLFRKRKV